jgi:hypothetical protein
MKKVFALLTCMLLFSCDDGDLKLESFVFENVTVQKCADNNLIFKIKNDELLLINTPETSFANEVTPDGTPREVAIGSTSQIIYRKYSENLTAATICSTIAPASPVVTKEWNASGGKILIETNERFAADGITLIGYTHNIVFQNVSFTNPENSFSFETYIFEDYETGL